MAWSLNCLPSWFTQVIFSMMKTFRCFETCWQERHSLCALLCFPWSSKYKRSPTSKTHRQEGSPSEEQEGYAWKAHLHGWQCGTTAHPDRQHGGTQSLSTRVGVWQWCLFPDPSRTKAHVLPWLSWPRGWVQQRHWCCSALWTQVWVPGLTCLQWGGGTSMGTNCQTPVHRHTHPMPPGVLQGFLFASRSANRVNLSARIQLMAASTNAKCLTGK